MRLSSSSTFGLYRRGLLYLPFVLLLGTLACNRNSLEGYWNLKVPNDDGTSRQTFFELHQDGDSLHGTLLWRGPNGTPLTGTLQGTAVHLTTVPGPDSHRAPTVWDGTYQDNKLTLTTQSHGESVQGEAERVTKAEAAPPSPAPLPALHDLPDNGLVRTPPMGWNSWNKFAGKVDDATVRSIADAMVSSGMSKAGYTYINIDDTWELGRDSSGNITTNKKFPNMKALADYVHSKGLKIGIYSSPGPRTCAGYEGSYGHELQDAKTYAAWGIDYLKYDLCSAGAIYPSNAATHQALYQKMGEALQSTGRSIVFSLCQYGLNDPWKWGAKAGGNLWRTTDDIKDNWKSMDTIGFSQLAIASYTRPGHWNDPDMLEIGNGGMSADEYRTHMSLWSMLSAPLIAGNDLRSMDDETKSILMNTEVIAIDQDPAAKPTQVLSKDGDVEILWREMQDGSIIVGLFNRGGQAAKTGFALFSLPGGFAGKRLKARDLWKHQNVAISGKQYSITLPTHGVVLLRLHKA